MNAPRDLNADSAELEALFDSIANEKTAVPAPPPVEIGGDTDMLNRVGKLTRSLHDTLAQLGYAEQIQQHAAGTLPDNRERLAYVARMTEQAASRTLAAIEIAQPLQSDLGKTSGDLAARWDAVFRNEIGADDFRGLATETRDFLRTVPEKSRATGDQLREIMMAQDFQDLTGQVIRKITECAQQMEGQLLKLLVDHAPPEKRQEANSLLNGPQISGKNAEAVANQAQVDELLESLGF